MSDSNLAKPLNLDQWRTLIDAACVYEVAKHTPTEAAPLMSSRLGVDVFFKREDQQPVFSFKIRGAYNRMQHLGADTKGVVCASAGNHAQGVALSASKLCMHATVVMPATTPKIKVEAVQRFGGKFVTTVLHGDTFDAAKEHALLLSKTQNLEYIPPFDDPFVIAGQATVGTELAKDAANAELVFVPTGGGGLLAGVAAALALYAPHVKVVAVEPEDAACFKAALESGGKNTLELSALKQVGLFVDGVAVAKIGALPFEVTQLEHPSQHKPLVNEVVTCSSDEVCATIKDVFEETRSIVEPAGALALAGLKKYIKTNKVRSAVCVLSGANMNFDRLRYIAERTEIGEEKEAVFGVEIPEQKGAFLNFCRLLEGRSITEFNYRFHPKHTGKAPVFVGIGTSATHNRCALGSLFTDAGLDWVDLTQDELAKNHLRHLIGGKVKPTEATAERLFSAQFPERPGALLNFLEQLGCEFNISLFHYRNHGAAVGRVLFGVQGHHADKQELEQRLGQIGYECEEVTGNTGLSMFL